MQLELLAARGLVGGVYKYYKSELMWGAILGSVMAYDLVCEEQKTLSETFRRQPLALQVGELALLSSHLLGVLPEKYDPFQQAFRMLK